MRLEPVSNVDSRRSLKERISSGVSAMVNIEVSLEFLSLVATVVAGVGILGVVVIRWLLQLLDQGHYLLSLFIALLAVVAVLGALARIPIAMLVVAGSAVICGTAFLLGASNVLLP